MRKKPTPHDAVLKAIAHGPERTAAPTKRAGDIDLDGDFHQLGWGCRHAARHLAECGSLAPLVGDYGRFETHEALVARLRTCHRRKAGFWTQATESFGAEP